MKIKRRLKFVVNWLLFIISGEVIALIGYINNPTGEEFLGFITYGMLGCVLGFIFAIIDFIDDITKMKYSFILLGAISGVIVLTGITLPVFYLKRKRNLSIKRKLFFLTIVPFIINLIIFWTLTVRDYIICQNLDEFKVNLAFSLIFSLLLIIPTFLCGIFNLLSFVRNDLLN